MLISRFHELAEEFGGRERALLDHKRSEYASQEADVLENFHTLGALLHQRPEQVAATLLAKHIQAILKQVQDDAYSWSWASDEGEGLKQRISDARNYLLLLAACIDEHHAVYISHDYGYADSISAGDE